MKAIQVKYLAATNYKPSRMKAWADGIGSITVSYDYGDDDQSRTVALALLDKAGVRDGWMQNCRMVSGVLPNGDDVFVFVFVDG